MKTQLTGYQRAFAERKKPAVNSKCNAKEMNNQRKNCLQVLTHRITSRLPYAISPAESCFRPKLVCP